MIKNSFEHRLSVQTIPDLNYSVLSDIENSDDFFQVEYVFLHGFLDNALSFKPMIEHYQIQNYLAFDLLGHGLSDHLREYPVYHYLDQVLFLAHTLEELRFSKKIKMIGHSLGGAMSIVMASLFPELISKVVMLDILSPLVQEQEKNKKSIDVWKAHYKTLKSLKEERSFDSYEKALRARMITGGSSRFLAELLATRSLKKMDKENLFQWRHDRKLLRPSQMRFKVSDVEQLIQSLSAEVYYLEANQGLPELARFQKENFLKNFSSLEHEVVEGGHHVHAENVDLLSPLMKWIECT